ncbi:4Fe-4S binding protein [Billgrantia endophytica]|uniref:Ferredoxin n=1 Tax=Billgrantia endophytica TaxID=2033802 RepID=A0A2N7U005_9GAMM|nr:4Fe-4S binding protein [Halomonas endophytica]PMR73767.1 ferredoxin [Halomonas endophytica]
MALKIVESCVNCWACVDVCPSDAIHASDTHFKIDARKCTECDGDYAEQQCASICPIEGAILLADGAPANPLGSLTGIPPERMAEAMRDIQAR